MKRSLESLIASSRGTFLLRTAASLLAILALMVICLRFGQPASMQQTELPQAQTGNGSGMSDLFFPFVRNPAVVDEPLAGSTYHFTITVSAPWNNGADWALDSGPGNGGGFPNAIDDTANFALTMSGQRGVSIPTGTTITVGTISLASSKAWLICNPNTGGNLVFDVSSGSAAFNLNASAIHAGDDVECATTLNDTLIINPAANNRLDFFAGINGSGGITKNGAGDLRVMPPQAGTNTYTGTTTVNNGLMLVNTNLSQSAFSLTGGTLGGGSNNGGNTATTGAITATGGTIAPGSGTGAPPNPDILNVVGNVSLNASTTYAVEMSGTTAGAIPGYDQLNVTGGVTLGGSTLSVTIDPSFTPAIGNTFTIINNDASDAITGRFNGLPNNGSTFTVGSTTFSINYAGGSNSNDVVLTVVPATRRVPFDFDGDGKTDISIFRPGPGEWWYLKSSNGGNAAAAFGTSTDKLTPGDFTGDGKSDFAFYRPSTGFWFILRSEDFSFFSFPLGVSTDVPVPADYDADGKTDAAVFRPSTREWFINKSTGGTTITTFGAAGDLPVPADYDGDGKADIAIYRPSTGEWWLQRSTAGLIVFQFGNSSDKTVPGDYTGDGKADVAFWRPSTGTWFVLRSEDQSFFSFPFGLSTDVPSPGDYDGDGKFDAAVLRPSNNTWFVQRSTAGTLIQPFGIAGDISVPNAFVR